MARSARRKWPGMLHKIVKVDHKNCACGNMARFGEAHCGRCRRMIRQEGELMDIRRSIESLENFKSLRVVCLRMFDYSVDN